MKKLIIITLVIMTMVYAQCIYADTLINVYDGGTVEKIYEGTFKESIAPKKELNWMVRATMGGYDLRVPNVFPTEKYDYHTASMALLRRFKWTEKVDVWFGPSFGLMGARNASAPIFGADLMIKYTPFKNFGLYLQPYGGLYYAANHADLPYLAESLPLGKAGFEIGYQWERFGIGYVPVEHYSSVRSNTDCGWNVGLISLNVKF